MTLFLKCLVAKCVNFQFNSRRGNVNVHLENDLFSDC